MPRSSDDRFRRLAETQKRTLANDARRSSWKNGRLLCNKGSEEEEGKEREVTKLQKKELLQTKHHRREGTTSYLGPGPGEQGRHTSTVLQHPTWKWMWLVHDESLAPERHSDSMA